MSTYTDFMNTLPAVITDNRTIMVDSTTVHTRTAQKTETYTPLVNISSSEESNQDRAYDTMFDFYLQQLPGGYDMEMYLIHTRTEGHLHFYAVTMSAVMPDHPDNQDPEYNHP